MKAPDITGNTYGNLTVVKQLGKDKFRRMMWECKCVCGNTTIASTQDLRAGHKKGCGCTPRRGRKSPVLVNSGIMKSVKDYAKSIGLNTSTVRARLRYGWTMEEISSTPKYGRRSGGIQI